MITKRYSADSAGSRGFKSWRTMAMRLWDARELIAVMMRRDISIRYRQSILGYLWAVIPQITTAALFVFLARHRVFDMGQTALPYIIHALWSISVWQLFATTLVGATNSLVLAGALVTKIEFPKEALIIAPLGQATIDFLIRLAPISAVALWYGYAPAADAILVFLPLLAVVALAIGIGFITAIMNVVFRDIGNALTMLLTFGMFCAPILYPPPTQYPFSLVNVLNPFSPLLIATQELLAGRESTQTAALTGAVIISIIVLLAGWRIFCITLPRITERA